MGKYDDIIDLPHYVSQNRKPMSMKNRAAQFAPFAALSGHEDAISETSRVTERIKEISEIETDRLSRKLKYSLENSLRVKITHFIPDTKKTGGIYSDKTGIIKKWLPEDQMIVMNDDYKIPVAFISEIKDV